MKKIFYLFNALLLLLMLSCTNEFDNLAPNNSTTNESKQVSLEEANAFVNKIIPSLDKVSGNATRSVKTELQYDVLPIKSASDKVVMYAINFRNNNGYILLSANKEDKSILAMNDKGNIDSASLMGTSAFSQWIKEKSEEIETSLNTPQDKSDYRYGLWNYITNQQDTIVEIEFVSTDEIPATRSHENSYKLAWVDPVTGLYCNWGQQSPYNYHAPSGALAGCPAVAVGMLCFNYYYPEGNWTYWKMPYKLTNSGDNDIARLFRYVADQIPNYQWGTNGSGAMPADILTGIKKLGYKNATMQNYDFRTVYDNLYNERPVLIGGYSSYGGGHIWYCDGYKEITYKVTRKFAGIKIKTWYEYDDMLYMNWGWNGDSDGWYNEVDFGGLYNVQRQIYVNLYPPTN